MDVFGDNETGKTTLFDAYCWLLFGKDSRNQAEFAIKTLNADGEPVHNLTHTVEAEFRNGSSTITQKGRCERIIHRTRNIDVYR